MTISYFNDPFLLSVKSSTFFQLLECCIFLKIFNLFSNFRNDIWPGNNKSCSRCICKHALMWKINFEQKISFYRLYFLQQGKSFIIRRSKRLETVFSCNVVTIGETRNIQYKNVSVALIYVDNPRIINTKKTDNYHKTE